jgi:hypothetical protein
VAGVVQEHLLRLGRADLAGTPSQRKQATPNTGAVSRAPVRAKQKVEGWLPVGSLFSSRTSPLTTVS